ncbi:MAG TPA: 2-phosphosulfolactate phosphatase [Synergistaceae bacterium]|nr:2-phosphosulfolactate phosphatase [Synergistaceae bacterium]HPQ36728.1 2-phosphosulfolactate phosphatase [Synergistaceae bacterium]
MPSLPEKRILSVVLSPLEPLPPADIWLVLDLLRATTTMVTFLSLGGERLYPVETTEEAEILRKELGRETLLMGERNSFPPEGFDLGNSPRELSRELCQARPAAVMTTTNGTGAVLKAYASGKPVLAASIRNASRVVQACCNMHHVGILCAGRQGKVALDDTLGAGYLVDIFCRTFGTISLRDGARIALWSWQRQAPNLEKAVRQTDHASLLEKQGFGDDISFCCVPDATPEVPLLQEEGGKLYFAKKNRELL